MITNIIIVVKDNGVNLKRLDNFVLYIKTKGINADMIMPTSNGRPIGGALKIERDERIDNISTNSASTESTNQPV